MATRCEDYNRVAVLSVEGDLDDAEVVEAREKVRRMIEERRVVDFVVDLAQCGSVTSEGLETLLWLKRRCEDLLGRVTLAGCDENVTKILEMTRLRGRFECVAEVETALKHMRV